MCSSFHSRWESALPWLLVGLTPWCIYAAEACTVFFFPSGKKENEHWQTLDLLQLFNGVTRTFTAQMRDDKPMTHCAQSYGIFLIGSVYKEHTSCGDRDLLIGRKVCGWADSFRLCHGTSSSVKTGASGHTHEFS